MASILLRALPSLLAGALLSSTALAQCPTTDDTFAPNAECYTVATVGTGLTTGLVLFGAASTVPQNDDYFTMSAQLLAGETIWVEVVATGTGAVVLDIDMYRSDVAPYPTSCVSATYGGSFSGTTYDAYGPAPRHKYTNITGSDVWVFWVVEAVTGDLVCADYTMNVYVLPAPCINGDDVYEDNDTCAQPAAIPPSGTGGLQVHGPLFATGADSDFWSLTLANSDRVEIDVMFEDYFENIDINLYDVTGGCPGVLLESSTTTNSNEALHYDNVSGAAVNLVLEVLAGDTNLSCNEYALEWSTYVSPCAVPDDALEDNDDCATAVPLPTGVTTGLVVFGDGCSLPDNDFYTYTVAANERLTVEATFIDDDGDIDLYLYDVSLGCPGTQIASASGYTDIELLIIDNTTAGPMSVVLEVRADYYTFESNSYDLNVYTAPTPCGADDIYEDNDDCATATVMTAGSYTGLKLFYDSYANQDVDFYSVVVQPLETVVIDIYHTVALGGIDIDGFLDTTCPSGYDGSTSNGGNDHFWHTWVNGTGAPATFVWRIDRYNGTYLCNTYDMDITLLPNTCPPDDVLEDNDTCGTPAILPTGLTTGLVYYANGDNDYDDEDWYQVTVPAGQVMTLTLNHVSADGQLDLDPYLACDPTGTTGEDSIYITSGTFSDTIVATYDNLGTSAVTINFQVDKQTGVYVCNDYSLDLVLAPSTNPCAGVDDAFEDNDDCATAVALPVGLTTGFVSVYRDADYYSIDVSDGATLNVDLIFLNADGDIDTRLYEVANCGTYSYLDADYMSNDGANLNWTNTTGATVSTIVMVEMYSTEECNNYDMDVSISFDMPGVPFCLGDGSDGAICPCGVVATAGSGEGCPVGTTGLGAYITATGTPSVAADTLVLTVSQAAPSDFGIFVQNTALGTPTPFYNGVLCLAQDVHLVRHYSATVPATFTDTAGMGVNSTTMTIGDWMGDTAPGVTIYYQFWGRDNANLCGAGANFSSGLSLTWLP